MVEKEKNYISAVVYLGNEAANAEGFLGALTGRLAARFQHYELIFVNDASTDGTEEQVRGFIAGLEQAPPVTIIRMSLLQGVELAMNAGIDAAIGDFIYEFDSMAQSFPPEMIDKAYDTCLLGNDVVTVSPAKNRSPSSSLFYKLFNAHSGSLYKLRTDAFRLLSRRAVNRVHAINPSMPYRKASYAASGLKAAGLVFEGAAPAAGDGQRSGRAVDSLLLYTNLGYRVSIFISILMLLFTVGVGVYTLAVLLSGMHPVEGWTTTMLVLTGGFFGVFLILSIVLRYLSLLLDLLFRRQKYLVESVEKLP